MPQGADLTLGTIFAGRVDASFRNAVNDLKSVLQGLARAQTASQASTNASAAAARRAGGQYQAFGKQIGKVTGGFQRLTAALKVTASYGLAGTFLFGMIRGLKSGVVAIADFDQALKNLQAITSATNPEIAALRDVILDVAANTKYSAIEVSEAAITLGQAGFTASESLDVLKSVAELSTGTLSSMKLTSDLLTSALRAFGEGAQQASRYADIFASAINRSKLDVQKLRIAFNYLGPIAHQVGLDLENTAAGAMVLANAGLRGSTIGTGFRRVLQLLVNPTQKLQVLFANAGADLNKLNPAISDMSDIVGELSKLLGKSVDPAERARRAFELFGLRGATVAAALGQAGKEGFEAMLKEVYRVGVASQMAEKQMEGLSVMAKNLMDRMVNLAISIGEGGIADAFRLLLPFLRTTVSLLTDLVNTAVGRFTIALTTLTLVLGLTRLALRYLIIQLTAVAAGMNVAVIQRYAAAHGLLATAIQGVTRSIAALWTLLKTNPWFLLATAISTVVVGIYTYVRRQKEALQVLEKEGVQIDKNIQKLEGYSDTLKKSKEGSLQYRSVLERLIKDYPELASQIDLVNGKFLDQGKALDDLINKYQALRLQNLADVFSEYVKRIESTERNIRGMELAIQNNRRERAFVERYTDRLNKLRVNLRNLRNEQTSAFEQIGAALLKSGLTTSSTFENIRDKIIETFGIGKKQAEGLAGFIEDYYTKIRESEANSLKNLEESLLTQENIITSYGDKWLTLYRKLNDLRKADLLETIYEMQAKIEKMEKTAAEQGWTEEQLQARIRALNDETYRNFVEKETAKEKRARKTAAEIRKAYLRSSKDIERAEIEEARANAVDRAQRVKENIEDAGKRAKLLVQIEETLSKDILKIQETHFRKRKDLEDEVKEYALKSKNESVEAEIVAAEKTAEAFRRRVIDEVKDAELRRTLLVNIEDSLQKDIERIRQKYADKAAGSRKEKILSLIEEYRVGLISAQQYYNELDRLAEDHLISERQRALEKEKINENLWESLRNGFRRALYDIKTWSEVVYEIGSQVPDKFSSDMTDALIEFGKGAKSMSQAFGEAAQEILEWLTKIILKQLLLKAIQDSINYYFGGSGSSSYGNNYGINQTASEFHKGGIVGKTKVPIRNIDISSLINIPKYRKGLKQNEQLAVLEKGEEVTPKNEVGKEDKIQIIVNKAPPGTEVTQDFSASGLKRFIIDVGVGDLLSGGKFDKAFRSTYGLGRSTVAR